MQHQQSFSKINTQHTIGEKAADFNQSGTCEVALLKPTHRRRRVILATGLVLVAGIGVWYFAIASGRHADSPEEAIALYLDASMDHNQSALRKVWWISEDDATRDNVIEVETASSAALARFHERMQSEYEEELKELQVQGKVRLRWGKDLNTPSTTDIKAAVENALKEDDGRLVVFLPDRRMFHVGKHREHWYVEHIFFAVGRQFLPKDFRVHEDVAEMCGTLEKKIGKPGISAWSLLVEQQRELERIAGEYGAPLLF